MRVPILRVQTRLARRLLNQRSASDDMERLMISKLKSKCGAQFTAKMEGMLNDLSIGSEHAVSFEKYCKDNTDRTGECANEGCFDLVVRVCVDGEWMLFGLIVAGEILFCCAVWECG